MSPPTPGASPRWQPSSTQASAPGGIPPGVPGAQLAGSRPAGAAGGGASGAARTNPNITLNAQAAAAGQGGARRGPWGSPEAGNRSPGLSQRGRQPGFSPLVPLLESRRGRENGGGGVCWGLSRGCTGSPWGPPPGRPAISDQGKSGTLQPGCQPGDRSGGSWVSL